MTGQEVKLNLNMFGITPISKHIGNAQFVLLKGDHDNLVIDVLKSNGAKWNKDSKCWYVRRSKLLLTKIIKSLAEIKNIEIERKELQAMIRLLELKGYSKNTIKNYRNSLSGFIDHFYPRECEFIKG